MAEHIQTVTRHDHSGSSYNPLGIKGVDHIEFFVDDVDAWSHWHENKLGMYRRAAGDPSTGLKGRKAVICSRPGTSFSFVSSSAAPFLFFLLQISIG